MRRRTYHSTVSSVTAAAPETVVLPTDPADPADPADPETPEVSETALVPVEPEPVPVPAKVTIVRQGDLGTLMHPIPKPLPEHHRRRAHRHQRVVFVLLLVVCLASAVPITRAIYGLRSRGAALGLADGSPVPAGPWSTYSGSAPLGIGGGAGPGITAPGTAGLPVNEDTPVPAGTRPPEATEPAGGPTPTPKPEPKPTPTPTNIYPPPREPWPPNPWVFVRASYRIVSPGNFYPQSFGQCTWWALRSLALEGYSTTRMEGLGNARYWAVDAEESWRHLKVTTVPIPNSTVVFQPGIQGAGGGGHVAHVLKVFPDGWFEISEMNFYWNGGGWGRVSYRYAHAGWGVAFILPP